MVNVDTTTLKEKAQEMGARISGIYAIVISDKELKIIDDGTKQTISLIHEYLTEHKGDLTGVHLRYVVSCLPNIDKILEGCQNRGAEVLYRAEYSTQSP